MKIAFVHGFILALGLILPLGVQNLFVLQQGMQQLRFRRTLPAVMTAASCDTLLIAGAVSGVSLLLLELLILLRLLRRGGLRTLSRLGDLSHDDRPGELHVHRMDLHRCGVAEANP